jgi:hypothetical protein
MLQNPQQQMIGIVNILSKSKKGFGIYPNPFFEH